MVLPSNMLNYLCTAGARAADVAAYMLTSAAPLPVAAKNTLRLLTPPADELNFDI